MTDVVIGRKLWQEWSEHWPGADDPFGTFINPMRRDVVTSTLRGDVGRNSAGGVETVRSFLTYGPRR